MLDGKEMLGREDKSVSTCSDLFKNQNSNGAEYYDERIPCNILTVEKLLTALINAKLVSIREMVTIESESDRSSYSYRDDFKDKEPPDKRTRCDRSHRSPQRRRHSHRCLKHAQQEEQQQRSSISKVQKWSDNLEMETTFDNKFTDEDKPYARETEVKIKSTKDSCTVLELESRIQPKRKKRRRRKKNQRIKKVSRIHPEDLPKRARWTIIITSGLLILTCMFLVGITLRMAPVIDQMVRTKNEELMNSLNRNPNPEYYSSIGTG